MGVLAFALYQGADALLIAKNKTGKPVDVNDVIKTTVTVITLIGAVLAGVYAMARLADDWPEQRQVCIDVLCAYLRMPYKTDPSDSGFKTGEREVRLTIIRIIRDHLQDPAAPTTWCGRDLDFTGAIFDGGSFQGAAFTGGIVSFQDSQFTDGEILFRQAQFTGSKVLFWSAEFTGGTVDFEHARITGGEVLFGGAEFSAGLISFDLADFTGGTVDFTGAMAESAAHIEWGPFPVIPSSAP
ncbi:pentapeptide repeat-containing protein [Streptomyces benahoarensis]|uniref:Pentapeptide repeat-containing protein n=1 Tax=Streptomyces benahoarensis TaxID=2595054 RepID=A0A553Z754_9ACTN|nr:pentapeptide repeat-containing protein [Streptomyces benahoarensis]TSB19293.1 pentapeptide repeat-containing protein [Streptomyces benahoarensis]TSB37281.1 pentapeptide repeat-containing protein [Streptomyces benahoarensis]